MLSAMDQSVGWEEVLVRPGGDVREARRARRREAVLQRGIERGGGARGAADREADAAEAAVARLTVRGGAAVGAAGAADGRQRAADGGERSLEVDDAARAAAARAAGA